MLHLQAHDEAHVMAEHPNAVRIRTLYEIGGGGDMDAVADSFSDDIVWNVPGSGPDSGAKRGKEATLAFFHRVIPGLESFKIEVHDVLANDAHAVVLVRYDHRRDGRAFRQLGAEVFHFDTDGRISAFWALIDDTAAFDEFFA
jgi:uncharacterized protein